MRKKQRRNDIAGAVRGNRQLRRAQPIGAGVVADRKLRRIGRRLVIVDRRHQHGARPERAKRLRGLKHLPHVARVASGQMAKLEQVRRGHVGRRHHVLPDEFGDAGLDIHAAAGVADHRIAAIERARVGALRADHGIEDRRPDLGGADIARQHAVAGRERAALLDALHHVPDQAGIEGAAAKAAIAGMVGELNGVHRPDLDAEPLQGEHRGRIADMSISHVRLERENVHDRHPRADGNRYRGGELTTNEFD